MPKEDLRGFDVASESDESLRERVGLLLVAASRSRPRDVELCVESCSENFGLDGAMLAEQGFRLLSGRFVASLAPITPASAASDKSLYECRAEHFELLLKQPEIADTVDRADETNR